MQQYYRTDGQGYYLEPVIAEYGDTLPGEITDAPLPQPCWLPRWTGSEWVEEAPKPTDAPPDGCDWQWDGEEKEWVAVDQFTAEPPVPQALSAGTGDPFGSSAEGVHGE